MTMNSNSLHEPPLEAAPKLSPFPPLSRHLCSQKFTVLATLLRKLFTVFLN